MKKLMTVLIFMVLLASGAALGETALEYAMMLESYDPETEFKDAEIPDIYYAELSADYDMAAREDESGNLYIACVRKSDAPTIPDNAEIDSYMTGDSTYWSLKAGEKTYYKFSGIKNALIDTVGDDIGHIFIAPDFYAYPEAVHEAMTESGRAYILMRREMGCDESDPEKDQLVMYVHTIDSWRSGATYCPTAFYADMMDTPKIMGEKSVEMQTAEEKWGVIPLSVYLARGGYYKHLVASGNGSKGVFSEGRIYEAESGYDVLMDMAEKKLGYRPGDLDILGKTSVSATLELLTDCITITDAEKLKTLDRIINTSPFTGGTKCPFNAFITLEYTDGTTSSIALATDSCSTLFYRGVYFDCPRDSDIPGLFGIDDMTAYN